MTNRTAVAVCQTIKGTDIDIRNTPGTTLMNDASGERIYTPPEGENLNLVDAGLAHRQTASTHLKRLCDIGILLEEKAGREKLFINPALIRPLSDKAS